MLQSYNAADYIDKSTIMAACDKIDSYAVDYNDMAKKVENAGSYFGGDALAIEGETLEATISDPNAGAVATIKAAYNNILSITSQIRGNANDAYTKLQEYLDARKAEDMAANNN